MEHFVSMEQLPPGVQFPPEFQDRLRFDASKHRLCYRGFMSKVEFDRLCQLSDDWAYRRPLEELFRKCSPEVEGGSLRKVFASITHLWLA